MKIHGQALLIENVFPVKIKKLIGKGAFSNIYSTSNPSFVLKVISAEEPKMLKSLATEKRFYD